jgi:hypothetical protein
MASQPWLRGLPKNTSTCLDLPNRSVDLLNVSTNFSVELIASG